jgi:hypothetical protein
VPLFLAKEFPDSFHNFDFTLIKRSVQKTSHRLLLDEVVGSAFQHQAKAADESPQNSRIIESVVESWLASVIMYS